MRGTKLMATRINMSDDQNIRLWWPVTKWANLAIGRPVAVPACDLKGNNRINPGSTVTVTHNAPITPTAEIVPSSRKGGDSLKFILKNPTAVVMLVSSTG